MTKHEKIRKEVTAAVKAALRDYHHFTESRHGHMTSEDGSRRYKFQAQVIRVERSFITSGTEYSKPEKRWTRVRSMRYADVYVDKDMRIGVKIDSSKLKGDQ